MSEIYCTIEGFFGPELVQDGCVDFDPWAVVRGMVHGVRSLGYRLRERIHQDEISQREDYLSRIRALDKINTSHIPGGALHPDSLNLDYVLAAQKALGK